LTYVENRGNLAVPHTVSGGFAVPAVPVLPPATSTPWPRWQRAGLTYGGDYNPEQWPEEVWTQDVRLMQEAGVNLVSVGIFSWALLQPEPGRYEFGWLDRVLDLLHEGGISVDLATASASPPPWFSRLHPDSLPVTRTGARLWPGGRQAFCPSSAAYRSAATALTEELASRYTGHPALAMWHVHNEYGCHNALCYCDESAVAFRTWLRARYGTLDALNAAWGTAFWSQHYYDWDEIAPARLTASYPNPTQLLDFRRFSSGELLDCYRAERDALHRITPGVPVTTNFMAPNFKDLDYWQWAGEMDFVSNDHYLRGEPADSEIDVALGADLTRGLAAGAPWLLMEHSTSAVNWQPRNLAKVPGQLRRNSLGHVARGADGVMFFQWRAARAGAEKFHSGLVPHSGTDTKIWREVLELGANLAAIAEVRGSRVESDFAILFDWNAWWAVEEDCMPSQDVTYLDQVRAMHGALWRSGVTCDLAHPEGDLSRYGLVLIPTLYLVTDAGAANVADHVAGGGTVVVGYFSGIVDDNDHIRLGGYPGAFREVLGVRSEEFFPLADDDRIALSDGTAGTVWSELLQTVGAETVVTYADGPLRGGPAITRNTHGAGTAWYLTTRLDAAALATLLDRVCAEAGVEPVAPAAPGVEVVRRSNDAGDSYLFVINHTETTAAIPSSGTDLLTGDDHVGQVAVPAGAVVVVRESGRRER
jgi:beta-galactosidase